MNTILQQRIEEAVEKIVCSVQCAYFALDKSCRCYEKKFCMKTAEEVLQNQWISVEEALPEENELGDSDFVFVKTSTRFPFPACYSYKHKTWKDINHVAIHGVTHWMPIYELKGGEE